VEYVQRRQQGAPESEPRAVKIVTKSGEERWLDGSGVAVELEGKPLVLVAVMDITERKHAGEALRKSEEKYHAVLENASDAILLTDEHGNILEVNRKAEELLGYIKEEFLQMNYTQLHPMIELERTIDAFKKIVEQGYGTLQDGSICRKDGKVVPVDITGSVIQYAGMKVIQGSFRDISEHKHAADSLERLVKKRTAELTTKNEQLIMEIKERKRAEASLRKRTNELQLNSNKLSELNAALKVLLIQRDEDKRELEEKVMANVKELLLPYLEELKTGRLDARNKVQVSILEANLKNIISPFTHRLSSKYSGFTPREIQVANLIRQGKSTKEIAEYVGVSRSAINLYRNGIRSKLGIISKKINLRSHLMSLS
jgi:PAS domain S-box-containing protein